MSVTVCRAINARLRAAGVTVREYPGWETRGNGQSSAYEGGLVHHTATAFGVALPGTGVGQLLVNGRPDLNGPLCNYAGNDDGSVTVIAANPANHAGASGGRSMGPLPTTRSFNRLVLGLEIVYPGTVPMRTAQYRTALVWANAVADVCGRGDIQRVRAHAETSVTGKWDPGQAPNVTINMAAFRTAARIVGQPPPESEDENMSVAYIKGDSDLAIPGTNNTYGDVVFMVEWDTDSGLTRKRVIDPSDVGYRLWRALGRPIKELDQELVDAIPDAPKEN